MRPVIFDLDGVLVDSETVNRLAFDDYLGTLGIAPSARLFAITLGRRPVDFGAELGAALDHDAATVLTGLRAATEARLRESALEPMPGAGAALAAIAAGGRPVGLASSSERAFVEHALRTLGFADRFAALATGDEVAAGKPDPSLYLLAARRLGVEPRVCVAIEDSRAGAAAARAAGMFCVAVPSGLGEDPRPEEADAVVGDLGAAADLVLALPSP